MPKNIVVLSDGTGQEGGRGHDTNIYKLFRMLEDRSPNQVVFYDQGLGTDWHKVTGNAFGVGFSKNILQCYRFIYDNYEAGDRLFLLGFSRGAATVRSLSNFIHYFGILPKARPELIRRAWKLYKAGRQERPEELDETPEEESLLGKVARRGFELIDRTTDRVESALREPLSEKANKFIREHPNQWVSIEFLGVWDTVPALGLVPLAGLNLLINNIPWWKHRFHDFQLHESVKNAYHALSIDDDRLWFHPTIWKSCKPRQKVEQVWFSGSHTDVGGGFMAAGLSDVSLEWMVEKAISHGLRMFLGSRRDWNFAIAPDAHDRQHPPRAGFGKIYKLGLRNNVWDRQAFNSYGPPRLHQSVLDRAAEDPNYQPWILKQYKEYLLRLPEQFGDSLKEDYRKGYDQAFEAYYDQMMGDSPSELKLPGTRQDWETENPFEFWLEINHSPYLIHLQKVASVEELLAWIETYPPFQAWLAKTYPDLAQTEFGKVVLEPYSKMYEYRDSDGVRRFTNQDLDEKTCREKGYTEKQPLRFRDYDRDTLKSLLEKGLDQSPRGAYDNLVERIILARPIVEQQPVEKSRRKPKEALRRWVNRTVYDRERWYGKKES
jgi:hypothetical protein